MKLFYNKSISFIIVITITILLYLQLSNANELNINSNNNNDNDNRLKLNNQELFLVSSKFTPDNNNNNNNNNNYHNNNHNDNNNRISNNNKIGVNPTVSPGGITSGSNNNNNTNGDSSSSTDGGKGTLSNQQDANTIIFIILFILTGSVLIVYVVIKMDIPFIPESVAIVLYGILLGVIFRFSYSDIVKHVVTFDPESFFLFILPTIIFETGFSLPKTDFFQNIGPILSFAVFGTIITFLVVGFGIYAVGQFGVSVILSLKDSLAFGAIISSTDPVCTLAIFQALNVDPLLYMLVLGESILNDAASIFLYRVVEQTSTHDIVISCAMFLVVGLGSVILGIVMAILLSLILKWVNIGKFPALETIFMVMFSYMSYVLANALDISGVLAVFFFGITFNQYGAYSLSPYTKLTSRQLFRTAAFICETAVFIYMGMSLSFHEFTFDVGLFSWSLFFTVLSRALAIFPMCFILNKFIKNKIPWTIQIAIWFAGLRGAFAFALSIDYVSTESKLIRTNTLLVVIFTIFVFGIGTYPLLRVLGIKTSSSDQSLDNISKPMNKTSKPKDRSQVYQSIDDKYFKVWFRKKVQPLAHEAIEIFEKLVQSSHDLELESVEDSKVYSTISSHKNQKQSNNSNNLFDDEINLENDDHHDDNSPLI